MARVALPLWLALSLVLGGCATPGSKPADVPPPAADGPAVAPPGGGLDAPDWVERHPYTMAGIALVAGAVAAVIGIALLVASTFHGIS
jgi:hypothetical protein